MRLPLRCSAKRSSAASIRPEVRMPARRQFLALAAPSVAVAVCDSSPALAQAAPGKNRVVMQVSDGEPAKWNLALNNARNLQADLGAANVEIEIVAYGPGLGMLKRASPVAARVDEALTSGVKIVACENTMRAQKVNQADMLSSIGYVGAGV